MSPDDPKSMSPQGKAARFKAEVEEKIQKTIGEFADGKLNREQFQKIYTRYTEQLTIATQAMLTGDESGIASARDGMTVAVRQAYEGKAIGVMIYHNRSGTIVETLGFPDVPIKVISPILNDFTGLMQSQKSAERQVKSVGERQWLLLAAGKYSTIVTEFHNEPSHMQITEMERLHHDFEEANQTQLSRDYVEREKLAYPFMVFIEKKMQK